MFPPKRNSKVLPEQHGGAGEEASRNKKLAGSLSLEEVESQTPQSEGGSIAKAESVHRSLSGSICGSTEGWKFANLPVTIISQIMAFLPDDDTLSCGAVNLQWFHSLKYAENRILVNAAREWVVANEEWESRSKIGRGLLYLWVFGIMTLFYLWIFFFTTLMAIIGIKMGDKWSSPALTRFGWDGLILTIAEYSMLFPYCFMCCFKTLREEAVRDKITKVLSILAVCWYLSVYIVLMARLGAVRKENSDRWNYLWPPFALWGPFTMLGSMTIAPIFIILDTKTDPGSLITFLAKKGSAYRGTRNSGQASDQAESPTEEECSQR